MCVVVVAAAEPVARWRACRGGGEDGEGEGALTSLFLSHEVHE